jgi:D-beta-D-heptose 7-phosphate kinase/D-beta-D-heptose 1-phosphate adenosyltransferase
VIHIRNFLTYRDELKRPANVKLLDLDKLIPVTASLRGEGKRIVFTNGCFDILHVGHVRYLTAAKAEGDVLIVGLNSDRSIRQIKDPRRPIVPEDQRAEVLAGLECVDFIVLFDAPDPLALIESLAPDVLVKGDDWPEDQIIGADRVKAAGGKVVRVPSVPHGSTSEIIERIAERYGADK